MSDLSKRDVCDQRALQIQRPELVLERLRYVIPASVSGVFDKSSHVRFTSPFNCVKPGPSTFVSARIRCLHRRQRSKPHKPGVSDIVPRKAQRLNTTQRLEPPQPTVSDGSSRKVEQR